MTRLHPPTVETLHALRLAGRSQALVEPRQMPARAALRCAERLGLRVDRASTAREHRRLTPRWRQATLRHTACLADSADRHPRGRDKARLTRLVPCQWVQDRQHGLSTGPTGSGTTWLACA